MAHDIINRVQARLRKEIKEAQSQYKEKVEQEFSNGDVKEAWIGNKTLTGQNVTQVCLLVGCLTSQQHASVSQRRICSDNSTCCHTEIQVADQTFHLTQSQYTKSGQTRPSTDPMTPGAWQGSHWSANNLLVWEKSRRKQESNPGSSALEADALTTRPMRRRLFGGECTVWVNCMKGEWLQRLWRLLFFHCWKQYEENQASFQHLSSFWKKPPDHLACWNFDRYTQESKMKRVFCFYFYNKFL